jgi:hypothetical protein
MYHFLFKHCTPGEFDFTLVDSIFALFIDAFIKDCSCFSILATRYSVNPNEQASRNFIKKKRELGRIPRSLGFVIQGDGGVDSRIPMTLNSLEYCIKSKSYNTRNHLKNEYFLSTNFEVLVKKAT